MGIWDRLPFATGLNIPPPYNVKPTRESVAVGSRGKVTVELDTGYKYTGDFESLTLNSHDPHNRATVTGTVAMVNVVRHDLDVSNVPAETLKAIPTVERIIGHENVKLRERLDRARQLIIQAELHAQQSKYELNKERARKAWEAGGGVRIRELAEGGKITLEEVYDSSIVTGTTTISVSIKLDRGMLDIHSAGGRALDDARTIDAVAQALAVKIQAALVKERDAISSKGDSGIGDRSSKKSRWAR